MLTYVSSQQQLEIVSQVNLSIVLFAEPFAVSFVIKSAGNLHLVLSYHSTLQSVFMLDLFSSELTKMFYFE